MKRLVVVAVACIAIAVSVVVHKNAVGLTVGIALGTWYFIQAIGAGGGIQTVRLTRDPDKSATPVDPGGSIGMGLAAAGIASAVIGDPNYAPFRVYFVAFLVAGLLIAAAYAGKTVVAGCAARRREREASGTRL